MPAKSPQRRRLQTPIPAAKLGTIAIVSGLLCSCAAPSGPARSTMPVPPAPTPATTATEQRSESKNIAEAENTGSASVKSVKLVQHTEPVESEPESKAESGPAASEKVATFTPAERRIENPAIAGQACPIGCPPDGACPPGHGARGAAGGAVVGPRDINTDEYLCDGGDRELPVHYDRVYRNGLNTEDTVAEWTGPKGDQHVVPSNKACVYAPRFGEVRSFSVPVGGTTVASLASSSEFRQGVGLDSRQYLDAEVQKTRLDAARVRARASGLNMEENASGFGQVASAALHLRDTPPVVGTAFLTRGVFTRGEEAFIADSVQAAAGWTRSQFPVITARDTSAGEVTAEFQAAEIIGTKDMDKPGHLRIVKLADKTAAKPGEVVTFTIRYDNLGDKPIHHVRIVDNLTPRLEFVEGSGTSDRAGRLDVEPNGEGSLVLTFVVEKPVEGKSGGTVSFKARVK